MSIEKITAAQAAKICRISRQRWHTLYKNGTAPQPIEEHPRLNQWDKAEVMHWFKNREKHYATGRRNKS